MDYNRNLSESLAVVGVIIPAVVTPGAVTTAAINTSLHRRLLATINAGVIAATGTVDFQWQASPTSGGSYTLVPGSAITQILAAPGASKIYQMELKMETLAALGVGPFVKLVGAVGTANATLGVVIQGACDRYEPASDGNLAAAVAPVVL